MGVENRFGNLCQEGYRSLRKKLQGPVRYTVRARSLADPVSPDGFLNLVRDVQFRFARRVHEVGLQCHANFLNNLRNRTGHLLKPSLQTLGNGFCFFRAWESGAERRSRNSHHPFDQIPQRLFFGIEVFDCRTPLVVSSLVEPAGHRPLQAVDLGFQSGLPGYLPPPPQPFIQAISSWMPASIGGSESSRERLLGVDAARAFRTTTEKFTTHMSISIPLFNSGSKGIWSSNLVWKLVQSVSLKSGWSGGCWKDKRH